MRYEMAGDNMEDRLNALGKDDEVEHAFRHENRRESLKMSNLKLGRWKGSAFESARRWQHRPGNEPLFIRRAYARWAALKPVDSAGKRIRVVYGGALLHSSKMRARAGFRASCFDTPTPIHPARTSCCRRYSESADGYSSAMARSINKETLRPGQVGRVLSGRRLCRSHIHRPYSLRGASEWIDGSHP